jgi:hypothetical protein
VDNDGARLVLNELAVSYGIPYFDLGVGIEAPEGRITEAGGQLAVVLPGGPCLLCMEMLDKEAAYNRAGQRGEEGGARVDHGPEDPARLSRGARARQLTEPSPARERAHIWSFSAEVRHGTIPL